MLKGLKKKIKTMNNKMSLNMYLSTIEFKNKLRRKNRDQIMNMESILMVARWEGGVGEWMKR